MSDAAAAVKRIQGAAKQREDAAKSRREATEDLRRYCLEARRAGVSLSQIAREAHLSRQGVYDLLAERA